MMMMDEDEMKMPEESDKLEKDEEATLSRKVNINGTELQVKDIFPDVWDAKKFVAALDLIEKVKGEKSSEETDKKLFGV